MARTHARVLLTIWHDDDFLALSFGAQRLYLLALSQDTLNYCGVTTWTAKRWARLAMDTTPEEIETWIGELVAAGFVAVDADTDELWVCSYLKYDDSLRSPNLVIAVANAFETVHSHRLREGIVEWFHEAYPQGFRSYLTKELGKGLPEGLAKAFPKGLPEGFLERLGEPLLEGSSHAGARNPDPNTYPDTDPEVQPSPAPAAPPLPAEPAEFVEFWQAYPRKTGRPAALKAWKRAGTEVESVLHGLKRWSDFWVAARTETQFVPYPATWLNQRRWEDEPPPVVNGHKPEAVLARHGAMTPNGTWVVS